MFFLVRGFTNLYPPDAWKRRVAIIATIDIFNLLIGMIDLN